MGAQNKKQKKKTDSFCHCELITKVADRMATRDGGGDSESWVDRLLCTKLQIRVPQPLMINI